MKTIIKRQKRTIGAIVKIPLEKGFHTYARILKYDFAFYDIRTKEEISNLNKIVSSAILFITTVNDYSVTRGLWLKVGNLPLEERLLTTPPQFAQDPIHPDRFFLIENGIRRPATKEECKGLERSAVWTQEGMQRRLNDHYAGRKNYYIEKDKNLEGHHSNQPQKAKVA